MFQGLKKTVETLNYSLEIKVIIKLKLILRDIFQKGSKYLKIAKWSALQPSYIHLQTDEEECKDNLENLVLFDVLINSLQDNLVLNMFLYPFWSK